jgi:pimeloyl-ACP methyl ester carboxylesterase
MPRPSPRIVLIPGLGLDARSSSRVRERLPASVVHLPGMGLAKPVPCLDDLARRLVDELGEGPVVLVGHSQGCQVAVAAAVDPRVRAIVMLGPTTDPRLRSAPVLAGRWLRTALAEPWWQVPLVVAQWWRTGPRAMRALWRAAAPDDIAERLRSVRVPVIVVRGTRDRLCDGDWARGLVEAAPDGRLVELPGAAHMTPLSHPGEVARIALMASSGGSPRACEG